MSLPTHIHGGPSDDEFEDLEARVIALETKCSTFDSIEARVATLETTVNDLPCDIDKIDLVGINDRIDTIDSSISSVSAVISALSTMNSNLSNNYITLQSGLQSTNDDVEALTAEVQALTTELDEAMLVALSETVATLVTDLDAAETSLSTLSTTVSTIVSDLDTAESDISSLTSDIATITTDLDTTEQVVDGLVNLSNGIPDPDTCIPTGGDCDWGSNGFRHSYLDVGCCNYNPLADATTTSYYGCDGYQCVQYCFPGDALVETSNRGVIFMEELQVGDSVKSDNGKFSTVYGFGHRVVNDMARYYRFEATSSSSNTNSSSLSLEIAALHQVFVGKEGKTKYAKDVAVGDELIDGSRNDNEQMMVKVTKIEEVVKKGIYQPYTNEGTIVVNGVLTSNYCESTSVKVFDVELFDIHTFKYMIYAPARLLCSVSSDNVLCSHSGTDGRLVYNDWVKKTMAYLLPGYLEGNSTNYLDFEATPNFILRVLLLLIWIIPMFLLEKIGLALAAASTLTTMIWFHHYTIRQHQMKKVRT